jgi:hypothetical protein
MQEITLIPEKEEEKQFIELIPEKKKQPIELVPEERKSRDTKPADWKKELPGAIRETWEQLPAAQFGKRKYWEKTGKKLVEQATEFATAETIGRAQRWAKTMPQLMTFGLAEKIAPKGKVAPVAEMGKEAGRGAVEFALFIPKTAFELVKDPVKKIQEDPFGVILLTGIAAKESQVTQTDGVTH